MTEPRFTIRVYAIILDDNNQILLSDEYMLDTLMIKFPGGGLEFGEGPVDCLKREAIEEFGQEIEILSHFYTTDYYQKALFYENTQLLSIYYKACFVEPIRFKLSSKMADFAEKVNGSQSFRWRTIDEGLVGECTFPIDKVVAGMLMQSR